MNILEMLIGVEKLYLILIVENYNKLVLQTTLPFVPAYLRRPNLVSQPPILCSSSIQKRRQDSSM
jgi:hypothetical protein